MADDKFFNNQDVYVVTSYDNIIVVDPNKVVDSDGTVSERLVNHEELVMYASLEAKIIPRSKLVVGDNFNDTIKNIRVGAIENERDTTINFMKRQPKSRDGEIVEENFFDTSWTDNLTLGKTRDGDVDSQLLGITNISIKINTSFAALVTIEMDDVQGKVLFEQGENSPYSAFFQFPYPLFTLTVKGYYGKAIRYELMLKDFNARFDPGSGNYKITTNYISRSYALLSDITLDYLYALPHMYSITTEFGTKRTNTNTGGVGERQETNTIKSTKGFDVLKNVYSMYKEKGLIDDNFPEITLNQMIMKMENFERYVMEAYGQQDMAVLNDMKEYYNKINDFRNYVFGNITDNWSSEYIDLENVVISYGNPILYQFKKELGDDTNRISDIENAIKKLESQIEKYNLELNENTSFGTNGEVEINGETISNSITSNIKIDDLLYELSDPENQVDFEQTYELRYKKTPTEEELETFKSKFITNFEAESILIDKRTLKVEENVQNKTYIIFGDKLNGQDFTNKSFLKKITNLEEEFNKKKEIIEEALSKALAEKIASPDTGLGFNPTINNVMAVICASADAFLQLMDKVHEDAWEQRKNPIRIGAVLSPDKSQSTENTQVQSLLSGLSTYSPNSENQPTVYPWPQYYIQTTDDKGNTQFEDKYPGDPSVVNQVKGWMSDVWPEIKFVEEYIKGATEKETINLNYNRGNELRDNPYIGCNAIEFPMEQRPYINLNVISVIYELFERVMLNTNYTKLYRSGGYGKELYTVFGDFEFSNIKNSITTSTELIDLFKNFSFSFENIIKYMRSISNNGQGTNWNLHIRGKSTTPYISGLLEKDFGLYNESYLDGNTTVVTTNSESSKKLIEYLKTNQSDELTFLDGYPFNNLTWINKNLSNGKNISSVLKSNDTSKMFNFNEDKKTIASFSTEDKKYQNRPFSYFEWVNETNTQNMGSLDVTTNTIAKSYYNNKLDINLKLSESFIDYGNRYDTTVNNLTSKQTTSLFNTPYFINALMKGVENEKNGNVNPYVGLGYLYLNSLPLSTLREKFKTFENQTTTDLNYIFATLNKYGAIHKLPTLWVAKYGAIWHRYKQFKENNLDILDGIWEDFDYVSAYDPDTLDLTKKYKFKNYNNSDVEIQQSKTYTTQYQIDLGSEYIPPIQLFDTVTLNVSEIQNGFYPKVINDTYYFINKTDLFSGYTSSEIQRAQNEKNLKIGNTEKGKVNITTQNTEFKMDSWVQFMEVKNNTDFDDSEQSKILIIPSFGDVKFNQMRYECFTETKTQTQDVLTNNSIYNGSVRAFWGASNYGYYSNEMIDKPKPNEYIKYINPETNNKQSFNLGNDTSLTYSSIEDIFGVFTKEMLDNFEQVFLNFCQPPSSYDIDFINRGLTTFKDFVDKLYPELTQYYDESTEEFVVPNSEISKLNDAESRFKNLNSSFNSLNLKPEINLYKAIRSLLVVNKPELNGDINLDIKSLSKNQANNFKSQHSEVFLKNDIILKIGNPGKFNTRVYGSLTENDEFKIVEPIDFGNYIPNSLPTSGGTTTLSQSISDYPDAWDAMSLYVGEFNEENFIYSDNGSYLTDFFVDMEFNFTEENVKLLAPVIKIYATQKAEDNTLNKEKFLTKIDEFLGEQNKFQESILNHVFINANKKLKSVAVTEDNSRISNLDGNVVKLELWKSFQALNDKWIAGQDFKTRTIFEDFLFLDRANRPIGDTVVVNISNLRGLIRGRTKKTSLYSLIGSIYEENNFVFIPTPAYTNFYGRNERVKEGEPIPQDIPNDLFGTFMEVDTKESRPRMIGMYVGEPSSNLDMKDNSNSRKGDDSFDITIPSQSPLRENQENKTNYSDSNACVGFQVDFGKRNQGIFSSIQIDMNQHRNIGPTFLVLQDLGSQVSGQKVAQQSQSFYEFYKTRSYTCQIQSLGNAMIQPTMYFNLTNVPLFYGPYLIMNVSHNISNRGFTTNFDGVRVPKYSLESPNQMVASINRQILDSFNKLLSVYNKNIITGSSVNNILLTNPDKIVAASEDKCKSLTKYENKTFITLKPTTVKASDVINYLNTISNIDNNLKIFIYGVSTLNKNTRQDCYNNNLIALTTDKELKPENRAQFFNSQTCIESNGSIYPYASFENINKCMDYMIATFAPYGGSFIEELKQEIQITIVGDTTADSLAILYMSQIYERNPLNNSTPQQVYEIVNQKINNDTEYKKEYDKWKKIFESVIHKVT